MLQIENNLVRHKYLGCSIWKISELLLSLPDNNKALRCNENRISLLTSDTIPDIKAQLLNEKHPHIFLDIVGCPAVCRENAGLIQ